MDEALSKLRPHVTSKLAHQKKPALLLKALESSLAQPITATAYYAALVQTLQQAVAKELGAQSDGGEPSLDVGEGDLVPAVLYLLSTVVDFVPTPVLHSTTELGLLGPLFSLAAPADASSSSLLALFPLCSTSAPALRSLIHLLRQLLFTAPTAALNTSSYHSSLTTLLSLSLDARPRVRKVSQEAVRDVLSAPHPPATRHPYAEKVSKWLIKVLGERMKGEDGEQRRIWAVGFVRIVASSWPSDQITPLLGVLLPLPAHPHLQSTTLSLLSHLLAQSTSQTSLEPHKIPLLLLEILATPPTDQSVVPSWLEVIENGMVSWSREDPAACAAEFGRVWGMAWSYLAEGGKERGIGKAAEKCLAGLARYCVTEQMMVDAMEERFKEGPNSVKAKGKKQQIHPQQQKVSANLPILSQLVANLQTALHALRSLPHLSSTLAVLSALLSRLRLRPATSVSDPTSALDPRKPTAAQVLLLDLVADVAALRIQRGFEHKEKADDVLGMAIEVVGPEKVLEALPLNVEADRDTTQPGRAFLLPILRNRTTNTSLCYFTTVLVPLSEKLFNAKVAAEGSRPIEAKVYEALVDQVWGCLKGFCDVPIDLPKAFNDKFAALLTQVLYTQPSLRPTILRSLQTLVETSRSLSNSSAPATELLNSFGLTQTDGATNLAFLTSMAKNLLAVLFNVFSQVGREQRGMVGEVISSYLEVASDADLKATYDKVVHHLGQALAVPYVKPAGGNAAPGAASPTSHTMLDLLILLVPHLPAQSAAALFAHASGDGLIGSEDPAVQKKSYRLLARLIETKKVMRDGKGLDAFVKRLADGGETIAAAARRDRVLLLAVLIPTFPKDQLHLIPALLPEAVLATKEVNEKTRDAAFDLVVLMGTKMSEGGTIKRSEIEGMDADDEDDEGVEKMGDAAATIPEYITMVAAGLAGTSPHMISATITAISRLLFEFKDQIPAQMMSELIATLVVFVSSNNREIVKSSLGFVKVIVVSLSAATLSPHLPKLVPALLGWSHDHKNHFKGKVRHIFERLIRKIGYEDVARPAEELEGDGIKFLENIRKRKERSKRKKAAKAEAGGDDGADDDDDDDEPSKPRTSTGNAFEDALYGSESELDDSDDEAGGAQRGDQAKNAAATGKGKNGKNAKGKARDAQQATYLMEDGDEPVDLLDRTLAGRVSQFDPSATSRRRKPGQDAAHFKSDASTGRMIINEHSDDEGSAAPGGNAMDEDLSGRAYQEQLTSTEGMTRGQGGRIKFNKDTKRGREREAEGDVTMGDATAEGSDRKKAKKDKQQKVKIGGEFRAKHAGGDVKRANQPDPYAFVPLGQARGAMAKKGGKGAKMNITGKKRGSAA